MDCGICARIEEIKTGKNSGFVMEMDSGYVTISDQQFFRGYTYFLSKKHASELHEVTPEFRTQFLADMALVAEAVHRAFAPKKLNEELLGNTEPHMHWHIIPRYEDDPLPQRPIWEIDPKLRDGQLSEMSVEEREIMKRQLREAIEKVREQRA